MLTTTGTEFSFPPAGPEMFTMTCLNHPDGRWLTKNPHERSIHWVGWDRLGADKNHHPQFGWKECPCPFSDLRVDLVDVHSVMNS